MISGQSPDFFAGKKPAGIPLEKLAQEYWEWWIKKPMDIPKNSTTGLDICLMGMDKEDRVVFLVDPYAFVYNSECTINSDKHILIPLLVGECDTGIEEIENLRSCAEDADEIFDKWEVILDNVILFKDWNNDKVNVDLKKEILIRNSSFFNIYIPDDNGWEAKGGNYTAVVDGYYLPIKPLLPGVHYLTYKFLHNPIIPDPRGPQIYGEANIRLIVTD